MISLLHDEIVILQELDADGFRWAPKVQASSLTLDNAVGYPLIALSWVPGQPLLWSMDHPSRPIRNKVLVEER